MKKKHSLWRWWAKALGEKACKDDRESDRIAVIRTVIFWIADHITTRVYNRHLEHE